MNASFYEIQEAFGKALNGFTEVLPGLITFIVAFSPLLILGIIIYLSLKKYFRNRKIKKTEIQTSAV